MQGREVDSGREVDKVVVAEAEVEEEVEVVVVVVGVGKRIYRPSCAL
jgi:hypothetical protein